VCRDRRAAKTQVFDESQRSQEGVGQPAPRALRARGLGQPRSSASGSHVLVTRWVWWLPDPEFTLSLPCPRAAPASLLAGEISRS
jgi:hypothetical protein